MKVIHAISYATVVLTLSFMAVCAFWMVYPYQVTHIDQPIDIVNDGNEVAIGQVITQELNIHKPNNQAPIDISRTILCEDGNLVTLGSSTALNLPIGHYKVVNTRYVLPPKVLVGAKCVFVWRQSYKVNPLRVIPVEWKSETFTVKPKEQS